MHIGFALEYSLGHTTHARNLKQFLASGAMPDIKPVYVDVPFENTPVGPVAARLPLVRSNWTVRASLAARRGLKPWASRLDAALFHTQTTALFSTNLMRRVPSVISLDATPVQIDALGASYNHVPSEIGRVEAFKKRMVTRAFQTARHLVTWSEWAKSSLVNDYGIAPEKVTVIPPGIDLDLWPASPRSKQPEEGIDILFVGGDFARKGGETILAAWDRLPAGLRARTRLHLVTRTASQDATSGRNGVHVYDSLAPNSPDLRALYTQADFFIFPTRGDCLPLAVLEALASGLPVITTAVAALPEVVIDGENGKIMPVDDVDALVAAMQMLIEDADLRAAWGASARRAACARFDAARNYRQLVETVKAQAGSQ